MTSRRYVKWGAIALSGAVFVLAVIGAISVIEDPPWSDDSGSPPVLRDFQPDVVKASEAAETMARLQRLQRAGQEVESAQCSPRTLIQPYRYVCDVRYVSPSHRQEFQIVQRIGTEHFELVRAIPAWRAYLRQPE